MPARYAAFAVRLATIVVTCLVLASDVRGADPIRNDRFVVKLTAVAAARADVLPEHGLPAGLPELDRLQRDHGIEGGFRVIREHGTPIVDWSLFREIGLDRLYVLRVPETSEEKIRALVEEFARQPWVEYAEVVPIVRMTATVPNDARYAEQWAHDNTGQSGGTPGADMDSPQAWDIGTGNAAAIVAVVDTGADLDHPDLAANLIAGYDFAEDDADPEDDNGHGTATCGIAGARGNNSIGVAGVCWNCSVMPLRVFGAGGSGDLIQVEDGVRFAADNGADTISMSLAFGSLWNQSFIDTVDYAAGLGALTFASAANTGTYFPAAPSIYPAVVAVGGSDHNDIRLYSYGEHLDLSAPSVVLTTALAGEYDNLGGTSAACPHAAGVGALLRATDPDLHVRELRHLLRLGADDGVGAPGEDTPGFDQFMGHGRLNAHGSMSRIDGPWLAFDRGHYMCTGDVSVALKDKTAGASVNVTLTGDLGGDTETVVVTPVSADGYYEGSISISWAGKDGPVVVGDGKLDLQHGETVTATAGPLSANSVLDCTKRVCFAALNRASITGDCDADYAADPGETWQVDAVFLNYQAEPMLDVVATLESQDAGVVVLDGPAALGTLTPFESAVGSFRFHVSAGVPPQGSTPLRFSLEGRGWQADDSGCTDEGYGPDLALPSHRDRGPALTTWDFDDGTNMGWDHEVAHGTGDLPECDPPNAFWQDSWTDNPVTDRSHSGAYAMRLGNGGNYSQNQDAGLASPVFAVPSGGGAIGFYLWIDTETVSDVFATGGIIVEAKKRNETTWSYQADADYNSVVLTGQCPLNNSLPFGSAQHTDLFAGEGGNAPGVAGDVFDVEHEADLSDFAGEFTEVRFRFGSNDVSPQLALGAWVDTVVLYGPYTADSWPADAPTGVVGSDAACPASFDLVWDAVSGVSDYRIYRSETSCQDALQLDTPHATSPTPDFSDTTVLDNVPYYYAIEAGESGTNCATERTCVAGGCICALAADPAGLLVDRAANDIVLTWSDPGATGLTWNVYRDNGPDPALWGAALDTGITDADPGTPGIQYADVGGSGAGSPLYYLVTSVNACGESPLR